MRLHSIQRSIRLSLSLAGAVALALANSPIKPANAQEEGSAADLGVMEINLADVVKPTIGLQGALQGAGTPNQAGIGGFLPLSVGENSVWFLDALVNANFADREDDSSIVNTDVAGATISTSTRLGYRWLNGDRSWMYGINGGYDSRPMNSGENDRGIPLFGTEQSAFFQQVAVNAEAVSNDWNFNAYALIPVGDPEQNLNWIYQAGALNTYGLDIGYFIAPELNASVGYYYQHGDLGAADGSGVLGRLAYDISSGVTAGVNISYDEAFDTRVSADLKVRFGGARTTAKGKEVRQQPILIALSSPSYNRIVRVHDFHRSKKQIKRQVNNYNRDVSGENERFVKEWNSFWESIADAAVTNTQTCNRVPAACRGNDLTSIVTTITEKATGQ